MHEIAVRLPQGFAGLAVAVALAIVVLACVCRWQLHRLRQREMRSRQVEDALVQNAQGLILKVHGIVKDLPPDDPTRQRMEHALDQADQQLSEDRDQVHDLRTQGMQTPQRVEDTTRPELCAGVRAWLRRPILGPVCRLVRRLILGSIRKRSQ